ncbi:MAG: hypothetical protein WBG08_04115 [Litorimonas sp.]
MSPFAIPPKELVLPSPLQHIAEDILSCLENEIYYCALCTALTIPEICSGLAMELSEFVKKGHYENFVREYVSEYIGVSEKYVYALRGGIIHRGSAIGHNKIPYGQIVMTIDDWPNPKFHGLYVDNTTDILAGFDQQGSRVIISLQALCHAMIKGLENWYKVEWSNPIVISGLSRMLKFDEEGISTNYTGRSMYFGKKNIS